MRAIVLSLVAMAGTGCAPVAPTMAIDKDRDAAPQSALSKARVNGVELSYIDRGQGPALVFVHGGLTDYREWDSIATLLSSERRTVVYSRRYNFPNDNPLTAKDHSAVVEAADLAALVRHLGLREVDVAGVSYGAYTALELALREPRLVRSLTLVEPPLLRWLADIPGGAPLFDEFYSGSFRRSGEAFERGDSLAALRITMDYFVGPDAFDALPPQDRTDLLGNAREWQALTTSRDSFPPISLQQIRSLDIPVLMISGGKTFRMLKLTDAALEHALPHVTRLIVADGTHDVCSEQPAVCADAIRSFLAPPRSR